MALNEKQKRFCKEYVIDFNGTQAAIRAGYSKKTARQIATQHLSKLHIQKEIQRLCASATRRNEITVDGILQEYKSIAFSRINDYLEFGPDGVILKDLDEIDEDAIGAIGEVGHTVNQFGTNAKFKLHDKLRALEKLGEYLKMFRDTDDGQPRAVDFKFTIVKSDEDKTGN